MLQKYFLEYVDKLKKIATLKNSKLNRLEIIRFFLVVAVLTVLYIDRYGFGAIFAYFSLFLLIILWTLLFSYIGFQLTGYQIDYRPSGNRDNISGGISLVLSEKIDVDKILLTIIGILILLMIAVTVQMFFGEAWAIGAFAVSGAPYGYWLYDNWLKK